MRETYMEDRFVLELNHIEKSFPGVKALDDVTLKVHPGTVHALMGENGAGKSTLMNCLFGIYTIDKGEILLDGEKVSFANPAEALSSGIAMVHQELNQVLDRSIMENIWLGRYPMKGIAIDHKKMYNDTKEVLSRLEIHVDPKTRLGDLTVSMRQMIEIAKAVCYNAKVIVMDEPTSSLTDDEVEHLFQIIDSLRAQGSSIIYISHKMEEILRISDYVTIMRDGKWISTDPSANLTTDLIISRMVGRELTERYPARENEPSGVMLEVEGLTSESPAFADVSFQVREGEIFGIGGLVGSKRTEVLEALFGLRKTGQGSIRLHGKEIKNASPAEAQRNGFALVTEERRSNGIFADLSVAFNMIIAKLDNYMSGIAIDNKKVGKSVEEEIQELRIKVHDSRTRIGNLSGGNQQKVIIARWLLTKPEIFLLDEPTRGIDVGAKYEIYQIMNRMTKEGKSIIMISSEMPELLGVCDRIMVMSNGRQAGIFDAKEATQEMIMEASAKYL